MLPPHFYLKERKVDESDLNKITYIPDKGKCLTEDQARHIYKKGRNGQNN